MRKVVVKYSNGKINLQLHVSNDNGKSFYYCGIGDFCSNLLEAKVSLNRLKQI